MLVLHCKRAQDADGSEGEELFCRSRYIESMGLEENASENKVNSSDSPLPALSSGVQETEADSGNSTKDSELREVDDWEAFKEEFSSSKGPESDTVDSAYIKEQLLLNTLTYLHGTSFGGSMREVVGTTTNGTGVLTLSNLEMIEESELDRALETIRLQCPADLTPAIKHATPACDDAQTTTNGTDDSTLMSRLEELTLDDGVTYDPCCGEGTLEILPEPQWRGKGMAASDSRQTIYLDLRPEVLCCFFVVLLLLLYY